MGQKPATDAAPAQDAPSPDITAALDRLAAQLVRMGCIWLAIQSGDRQKHFNGVNAKELVDRAAILESFALHGASGSVATAASDSTEGLTPQA